MSTVGKYIEYEDDEIIRVLKAAQGQVYIAAETLGCSPVTIYKRIKLSPKVAAAKRNAQGKRIDTAVLRLYKAIDEDNLQAIFFLLKTLGRKRGFTEKQEIEHTGSGGGPIQMAAVDLRGLTDEQLDEWKQLAERQQALLSLARPSEPRPSIPVEPHLNGTGTPEPSGPGDPEQPG